MTKKIRRCSPAALYEEIVRSSLMKSSENRGRLAVVISVEKLAEDLGCAKQTITKNLMSLRNDGFISIKMFRNIAADPDGTLSDLKIEPLVCLGGAVNE